MRYLAVVAMTCDLSQTPSLCFPLWKWRPKLFVKAFQNLRTRESEMKSPNTTIRAILNSFRIFRSLLTSIALVTCITGRIEPVHGALRSTAPHLPVDFEANLGQADAQVKFLSRGTGHVMFLTATQAVWKFGGESTALTMSLDGTNPSPGIEVWISCPRRATISTARILDSGTLEFHTMAV